MQMRAAPQRLARTPPATLVIAEGVDRAVAAAVGLDDPGGLVELANDQAPFADVAPPFRLRVLSHDVFTRPKRTSACRHHKRHASRSSAAVARRRIPSSTK